MKFARCYCVVQFFKSGVTNQILEIFTSRIAAEKAAFTLAENHAIPIGDFIGISEQWQVLPDEAKVPQSTPNQANRGKPTP